MLEKRAKARRSGGGLGARRRGGKEECWQATLTNETPLRFLNKPSCKRAHTTNWPSETNRFLPQSPLPPQTVFLLSSTSSLHWSSFSFHWFFTIQPSVQFLSAQVPYTPTSIPVSGSFSPPSYFLNDLISRPLPADS